MGITMDSRNVSRKAWYAEVWDGEELVLKEFAEEPSKKGPYSYIEKRIYNGIRVLQFASSGIYLGSTIVTRV